MTRRVSLIACTLLLLVGSVTAYAALTEAHVLRGDVNEDGEITAVDALAILTQVVGADLPDGFTIMPNGDANGDGEITAIDALIVLSHTVGIDVSEFPVGEPLISAVVVSPEEAEVGIGSSLQLEASARDSQGADLGDKPISWASSDATVATIDQDGLLHGVAEGVVEVTAIIEGVSGVATVTVLPPPPAGFTKLWLGSTSDAWDEASNWSPAGAPTAEDTVLIASSATRYPALSATRTIGSLTMEAAAILNLGSSGLTVTGPANLEGGITGTGTVRLQGPVPALEGTLPNLRATRAAFTGPTTVTGNVQGDTIDLGGQTVTVQGNFSGWLEMHDPEGELSVGGNVHLNGTEGNLTAGVLRLSGGISGIRASENHKVVMEGSELQTTGTGSPVFQDLEITNPVEVRTSLMTVRGTLSISSTGSLTGGHTYIEGRLETAAGSRVEVSPLHLRPSATWSVEGTVASDNLYLEGSGRRIPSGSNWVYNNLHVNRARFTGPTEIAGNLRADTLDLAGQTVAVGGDFQGRLQMLDPEGEISVGGSVSLFAAQSHLTAGVLRVSGTAHGIHASGTHRVVLEGTGQQTTSNPITFQDLEITNPGEVVFGSTVTVTGTAAITSSATISGSWLVVHGHLETASGSRIETSSLYLRPDATWSVAGTIATENLFIDRSGLEIPSEANWIYHRLHVKRASVTGNMTLSEGLHADTLDLGGHSVTVAGRFAGKLTMRDPDGRLTVAGDVTLSHSDEGDLTAGVLRTSGSITHAIASGSHRVMLDGEADEQSMHGTFQHLEITNPLGVSIPTGGATVRGDLDLAAGKISGGWMYVEGQLNAASGTRIDLSDMTLRPSADWSVAGTIEVGNLSIRGSGRHIPADPSWVYNNLYVDRASFSGPTTIDGVLVGDTIDIAGNAVEVGGYFSGKLIMRDPAGSLSVAGAVHLNRAEEGDLTAGVLRVAAGLSGGRASGTHKVVFNGFVPQQATGIQSFAGVEITNPVEVTIQGSSGRLFIQNDLEVSGYLKNDITQGISIHGDLLLRSGATVVNRDPNGSGSGGTIWYVGEYVREDDVTLIGVEPAKAGFDGFSVQSLSIVNRPAELHDQGTRQLSVDVYGGSNTRLSGREVTWASANESVLAVDETGFLTAVAVGGPIRITAMSEGKVTHADIRVVSAPDPVGRVTVAPSAWTMAVGQSKRYTVRVYDTFNREVDHPVTWSIGDPSVATVDAETGDVTAVGPGGPVAIMATSEGVRGLAEINVSANTVPPVATIEITPSPLTLEVEDRAQFAAELKASDGTVLRDRPVTWSSSNGSVLSVDDAGLVTAQTTGEALLIASAESRADTTTITVVAPSEEGAATESTGTTIQRRGSTLPQSGRGRETVRPRRVTNDRE